MSEKDATSKHGATHQRVDADMVKVMRHYLGPVPPQPAPRFGCEACRVEIKAGRIGAAANKTFCTRCGARLRGFDPTKRAPVEPRKGEA